MPSPMHVAMYRYLAAACLIGYFLHRTCSQSIDAMRRFPHAIASQTSGGCDADISSNASQPRSVLRAFHFSQLITLSFCGRQNFCRFWALQLLESDSSILASMIDRQCSAIKCSCMHSTASSLSQSFLLVQIFILQSSIQYSSLLKLCANFYLLIHV